MPTITELRDDLVSEMSTAVGGDFATVESEFEAGLATAIASAVQPHLGGGAGESLILGEWNDTDLSQLTQVRGNGVGGYGTAGDWTLSVSSFSGSGIPAIRVGANVASPADAIWLFNDIDASAWPKSFLAERWSTRGANGSNYVELGLVVYYVDVDHWISENDIFIDDVELQAENGASGRFQDLYVERGIVRQTAHGDRVPVVVWLSRADGSNLPFCELVTDANYRNSGSYRAALRQADCDSDWLSIGSYPHSVGLFARIRTPSTGPTHEFVRYRFKRY